MNRPRLDLEASLNPQQLAAVTHGDGPQLVLAGAGSGKTRVITYRVAWLIEERRVDPERIVAVTFTNKAAREMEERVEQLLRQHPLPTFLGTFHRYALRLLRRYGERLQLRRDFAVMDANDQQQLVRQALEVEGLSDKTFQPRAVLAAISGAKNRLLSPRAYEEQADGFFERKVAQVYRRYQGLLQQAAGLDFDDMLLYAVRLLEEEEGLAERLRARVEHLLVDEFQDTNHAQMRMVQALAAPQQNLTAVGDEDQGIYRWRGADLDNILEFERSFPGAVIRKLEQNYRSTQAILDASGALIAHNRRRRGKHLWTEGAAGDPIQLYRAADEVDEARWLVRSLHGWQGRFRLAEMAVLVRTNAQTRALEEELLQQGMAYELVGGVRFYDRTEIKDLIAYLRVLRNPHDDFSLARILNQPPRGIGANTEALLRERAAELKQPVWNVLELDSFGSFPQRSAKALLAFRDLIRSLRRQAEELPLPVLLDELLVATGYADLYRADEPEGQARLENIREFLSAAQSFTEANSYLSAEEDLLTAFLDHIALVTDLDAWQGRRGISLMTLHSAKGLEFPVVAICGLEEGLLPHYNAQKSGADLEEERRLLYVGMTRAGQQLLLTTCKRRRIAGRYQDQTESPFLAEIPEEMFQVTVSPTLFQGHAAGVQSFFGERSFHRPSSGSRVAEPVDEGLVLRRGSQVRHPTLGTGVILDLEGEGEGLKIVGLFDRAGKRKLIARYANLELIG